MTLSESHLKRIWEEECFLKLFFVGNETLPSVASGGQEMVGRVYLSRGSLTDGYHQGLTKKSTGEKG